MKVVSEQLCGTGTRNLLYTDAIPNIISAELANHLKLATKQTQKTIILADGSKSICIGRMRDVPVSFKDLKMRMDFLASKDAP